MKRIYYFYANDLFRGTDGRIHLFNQEIVSWVIDNIESYTFLNASKSEKGYEYGVRLFNAVDAMAFKLRWS